MCGNKSTNQVVENANVEMNTYFRGKTSHVLETVVVIRTFNGQ